MFGKPIYVTEEGLQQLRAELEHLLHVKRPEKVDIMQDAKGNGDWVDNTEYMLVEDELAFIDGRIQYLRDMINNAELIEPGHDENIVEIGEIVVIRNEEGEIEKYRIVGVAETDPAQGLISNESPLGRALLNHKVGEEVIVKTPAGSRRYKIIAVTGREGELQPE